MGVESVLASSFSLKNERENENRSGVETPQFFPLDEGLELTRMEWQEDRCVLHVTATSSNALCPTRYPPA